jgi:WS/DGAT/MGAT family acyltransferase
MTDVEAMMWTVERDPHLSSAFGSVSLLDGPPDLDHLRLRMLAAAATLPRLRQRVNDSFGRLMPPVWEDDPDFAIERHVVRHTLPGADVAGLLDDTCRWVQEPFDTTHPLWEFRIVDGLADGHFAFVQKMHHTITDGEGGIRMSAQFLSLTPELPDVDVPAWPAPTTTASAGATPLLSLAQSAVDATWQRTRDLTSRAAGNTVDTLRHPTHLLELPSDLAETTRSALRQILITDHAHSPLWTERGLDRHAELLDIDFDSAYAAAKRLGGSLNDLFVTAAADAAWRYHTSFDLEVDELRMAMPVSTRTDRSAGGNSFVPTRVLVPTAAMSPTERFHAVQTRLSATKAEKVIGSVDLLASVTTMVPPMVLTRLARQQVDTIDFTTSNVRAAPFPLYLAGAHIMGTYPLGPLGGTAFNATMMSYDGTLNIGIHSDASAVTDPALLRSSLADAFAELVTT